MICSYCKINYISNNLRVSGVGNEIKSEGIMKVITIQPERGSSVCTDFHPIVIINR